MKAEYNPHPPFAVFLALPLAAMPFEQAYQVHRVLQIILLAVSWVWACRLAGIHHPIVVAVGAAALGLWPPVWGGLDWGQPVGVLALASTAIWHLVDGRRPALAGAALTISCLVRPLLAGYGTAAGGWRWRAAAEAAGSVLGGTIASFILVGITPWEWYQRASLAGAFAATGGSLPASCTCRWRRALSGSSRGSARLRFGPGAACRLARPRPSESREEYSSIRWRGSITTWCCCRSRSGPHTSPAAGDSGSRSRPSPHILLCGSFRPTRASPVRPRGWWSRVGCVF